MLKFRSITVNGKVTTRFDHPLNPGDKIEVLTDKDPRRGEPPRFNIEVVYDDESLIVINKPPGLLTVATEKVATRTAFYAVNDYLNKSEAENNRRSGRKNERPVRRKQIFIVHRLDQDASGLLVLAKNESVKRLLQDNWDKAVKKYYAVVEGTPREKSGTITSYLNENKILSVYSTKKPGLGKLSTTHYRVLKSNDAYSLLEIQLETGRKHQIRVHLSEMKHPIAGDDRYEAKTNPAKRLLLHAFCLSFQHPETRKILRFETPLPQAFSAVIPRA